MHPPLREGAGGGGPGDIPRLSLCAQRRALREPSSGRYPGPPAFPRGSGAGTAVVVPPVLHRSCRRGGTWGAGVPGRGDLVIAQHRERGDPRCPPVASSCKKKKKPNKKRVPSVPPCLQPCAEIEAGGGQPGGCSLGSLGSGGCLEQRSGGAIPGGVVWGPPRKGCSAPPSPPAGGHRGSLLPPASTGSGVHVGRGSPLQTWLGTKTRQER